MVVKKKKRVLIIILAIVLIIPTFMMMLLLFKGPTLIINNCNENCITNSRICNNGNDYYYVDNKGRIHHLYNDNEIINDGDDFKFITCNSHYIYAGTENKLYKLSFEGEIVNEISTDMIDRFYNVITGIQANEDCIICALGGDSYIFLDLNTLNSINLNAFMKNNKNIQSGNVNIYTNSNISLVHLLGTIDLFKPNYSGGIIINNNTILLGSLGTDRIIGLSDKIGLESCSALNGTTLIDFVNEKEYQVDKTDIRHLSLSNDKIVTFRSNYSNGLGQALSFPYYEFSNLDEGFINEAPLRFHKYDTITVLDPLSGEEKNIETRSGEKVIYLDDKKAITYYKGEYLYYHIDTWEKYRSEKANEINHHSVYRFESCGDYIFVFDKNYSKLLNRIEI
ncbi:MAG TPA: hypothetical protein P5191_05055 [Ruminococcus sp.]|nr:hypothetical protein [Ruminococcus sp.]